MGTSIREKVTEFHRVFGQPIGAYEVKCSAPPKFNLREGILERVDMRLRLIAEEFVELLEACGVGGEDLQSINTHIQLGIDDRDRRIDLVEAADALGDIAYVVEGMNLELGINSEAVLNEIHVSNLDKVWPDGTVHRREDGKILKPTDWSPPDIAGVLSR